MTGRPGQPLPRQPSLVSTQMSSPISRWPARATPGWRSLPVSVASFSVSFMVPEPQRWGPGCSAMPIPPLGAITPGALSFPLSPALTSQVGRGCPVGAMPLEVALTRAPPPAPQWTLPGLASVPHLLSATRCRAFPSEPQGLSASAHSLDARPPRDAKPGRGPWIGWWGLGGRS